MTKTHSQTKISLPEALEEKLAPLELRNRDKETQQKMGNGGVSLVLLSGF